jgi:hypothetical protein
VTHVEAKGAFKFASAAKAEAAIETYGADGYGVTAASDWRVAGAYAFIDKTLEFDGDNEGFESCFEAVARAAQEGELDLRVDGAAEHIHLLRSKSSKKPTRTASRAAFGEALSRCRTAWAEIVATLEAKAKKAKAKADALRAAREASSARLLVRTASFERYANALFVRGDTLEVLAGGMLHHLDFDGAPKQAWKVGESTDTLDALLHVGDATVLFSTHGSEALVIVDANGVRSYPMTRAVTAPDYDDRGYVDEVFPSTREGEVIVRERHSLRRIELASGRTLAEVPFEAVQRHDAAAVDIWPRESPRGRTGVRLSDGVAFGFKTEEAGHILVFDDLLEKRADLSFPGERVTALLARDGALLAAVGETYVRGVIAEVLPEGLGAPLVTLRSPGRMQLMGDEGLVVCLGSEAQIFDGLRVTSMRAPMSAQPVVSLDGIRFALADLTYGGEVHAYVDGERAFEANVGTTLNALTWVGESLIGYGYGPTLYWLRAGAEATHIVGHASAIRAVVALDASRFASLDDEGTLRIWDLGR